MKKKYIFPIQLGVVAGLLVFLLVFINTLTWQTDGFSMIEGSLLSLIGAFYIFITLLVVEIWGINKYIRECIAEQNQFLKKWYSVGITLIVCFLTFVLLDSLLFLIDDSVSKDYAATLQKFIKESGGNTAGIKQIASLPFALQNGIATFISGFLASLLSLIFIKKDGQLIKNKTER